MTRETAIEILKTENLKYCSFFEKGSDREDQVVIKKLDGKFIVYVTSERASVITGSEAIFDNENEAIDDFIKRTRSMNVYKSI